MLRLQKKAQRKAQKAARRPAAVAIEAPGAKIVSLVHGPVAFTLLHLFGILQ
jgi:hypothetical protein